jgi:hypothetical protein
MWVITTFAVLAILLSAGGCARPYQAAYARPITSPLPPEEKPPEPTKTRVGLPSAPKLTKVSSEARSVPEPTKVSSVTPLPVRKPQALPVPVEQSAEDKLKTAQTKAERLGGVHKLTQEDIDGLTSQQLKELRGY